LAITIFNSIENTMIYALTKARNLNFNEIPVYSLIILNGEIIAESGNRVEELKSTTRHAEIEVIEIAQKKLGSKYLSNCQLYVTLEPCPMCASAIASSKIEKVYFAAYDKQYGALGSKYNFHLDNLYNHTFDVFGGTLREESEEILKHYFKQLRNR
jgi:tRNA(adenine34) deaminase